MARQNDSVGKPFHYPEPIRFAHWQAMARDVSKRCSGARRVSQMVHGWCTDIGKPVRSTAGRCGRPKELGSAKRLASGENPR